MKCKPCEGGVEPFTAEQAATYLKEVSGWSIAPDGLSITKKYRFKNFKEALAFVDRVGEIAENEGHHPDINLGWGRVKITLSTHAIQGLSDNDFVLAYKIDAHAVHG